ncbi:MAG TPA: tetratricopeptide repeat-containing protein, partial [Crinalium sp.]
SRIGQSDEAIVKLENLLQDVPKCVDATTYLARIYKDLWKQNWMAIADSTERLQAAYEASFLLQKSIENYLRGYRLDQNQYYPGINALTLTTLLDHLAQSTVVESCDADERAYRQQLGAIKGSVQFCLESSLQKLPNDYWAALSLGDLAVCTAESPHHVATAYRKALAILWNNKFALQATLDQLKLMDLLNFRPDHVKAGIMVLQSELERFEQQEYLFTSVEDETDLAKPAQVFLFTGHMIDQPDRPKPRLPAAMEAEVVQSIEKTLEKLEANSNCIAITPGLACGGDILFVEACLHYNMRIEIYLPFEPSEFIQGSVSFAGDSWVERFYRILNHPNITLHLQPERLGTVPDGENVYGRNNRWTLYATLMHDIRRVRLIALWDGQSGDGPGGTADMVRQVRQLGGIVEHIDITKFEYWRHSNKKMEQIYRKLENLSSSS